MRISITTAFALMASILLLALPAAASAARWQVFDNSGKPVRSVVNGLNDAGSPCGWIRTGGNVAASVYQFTAGGFHGWMLSPGVGETPKKLASCARRPSGSPSGTRTAATRQCAPSRSRPATGCSPRR